MSFKVPTNKKYCDCASARILWGTAHSDKMLVKPCYLQYHILTHPDKMWVTLTVYLCNFFSLHIHAIFANMFDCNHSIYFFQSYDFIDITNLYYLLLIILNKKSFAKNFIWILMLVIMVGCELFCANVWR